MKERIANIKKTEDQLVDLIEKNFLQIFVVLVTILAVILRIAPLDYVSGDAKGALLIWYDSISKSGIKSLGTQVGDYNIFYQFIVYLLTLIPIKGLYAYKISSGIFDFILAYMVGKLVWEMTGHKTKAYLAYVITLILPTVVLNSSVWAQCDAMYVTLIIWAIRCMFNKKETMAFILLGVGFALKLQTIFIIPFFLFLWFKQRRYTIYKFFLIPLTMEVLVIPGLIAGRGLFDTFILYAFQTNRWLGLYCNYGSFWAFLFPKSGNNFYQMFKPFCVIFAIIILFILFYLFSRFVELNNKTLIYIAFIFAYTAVFFLPSMHERYGFLYEILAIIIVFLNKKTILPAIGVWLVGTISYVFFLFGYNICELQVLAFMNLTAYLSYIYLLTKDMKIDYNRVRKSQ